MPNGTGRTSRLLLGGGVALLAGTLMGVLGMAAPASATTYTYTPTAGIPAAPSSPDFVVNASHTIDSNCGSGLSNYGGPIETTIASAVGAAVPGQTIYVCAGAYAESVAPTNGLTIDGAQWSDTAVGRSTSVTTQSIIEPATNQSAVSYPGGALTGTLSGFDLVNLTPGATTTEVFGIGAFVSGTGYTWTNNLINEFTVGISFSASGTGGGTSIEGNEFLNNTADPSNGAAGQGIFAADGASNNVTVEHNDFTGDFGSSPSDDDCDINTTGSGSGTAQTGWVVEDNTTEGAGNFLVLFETTDALIEGNVITGNQDAAFYIGGDNTGATISDNTVSAGNGPSAEGFQLSNYPGFNYNASTDLTISGNTISGQVDGIELDNAYDGSTITGNTISTISNDCILTETGATGYSVTGNTLTGCAVFAIQDQNTGSGGTAGTGNTYTGNTGSPTSPVGLATPPPPPPPPATTFSITVNGSSTGTITFGASATLAESGLPSAATGTVTFVASSATLCSVTLTGLVGETTSCATLSTQAAGSYTVSASFTPTGLLYAGSTSTNTVTLTITPIPPPTTLVTTPTSGTTVSGTPFAGQLSSSGATGAVTYAQSGGAPNVNVSASGAISAPGTLAPGTYASSGSAADGHGDSGTWSFTLTVTSPPPPPSMTPNGYDLVGSDGGVFVFNPPGAGGGFYGSLPGLGIHVNNIVGLVPTAGDLGYYLVGSDGGVFAFGNAPYYGSLPGQHTSVNDIVGIVPTAGNQGYFLVGRDGGVFAFGNAPFLGSLPSEHISVDNVVGIAATPSDEGYWVVTATGHVYNFGNAPALASAAAPVTAIAATPNGGGYWLVGPGGGIFAFGDANYYNSLPGLGVQVDNVVGIVPSADGKGYLLIGSDGGTFAFGDATFEGSLPALGIHVNNIVGAVPTAA
jgi:parallel beta-helix repeat protein